MKQKLTLNVMVFLLLALHACPIASGQEKTPYSEKKVVWMTLKPGLKVLKLWESIGPKQPEIAILRLSDAEYKEFEKNPTGFVNANRIFSKDVNKLIARSELAFERKGYKDPPEDDDWLVMIEHDYTSNVAATSVLMLPPKP